MPNRTSALGANCKVRSKSIDSFRSHGIHENDAHIAPDTKTRLDCCFGMDACQPQRPPAPQVPGRRRYSLPAILPIPRDTPSPKPKLLKPPFKTLSTHSDRTRRTGRAPQRPSTSNQCQTSQTTQPREHINPGQGWLALCIDPLSRCEETGTIKSTLTDVFWGCSHGVLAKCSSVRKPSGFRPVLEEPSFCDHKRRRPSRAFPQGPEA